MQMIEKRETVRRTGSPNRIGQPVGRTESDIPQ
jgi:hypothetical protein